MWRWLLLLPLVFVAPARADSLWNHYGLTVRLLADGSKRQFVYAAPYPNLPIKVGGTLFQGLKVGNEYVGTAYAWTKNCRPAAYSVRGPISEDQQNVTLYGKVPLLNETCKISEYRDAVLAFNFIDPNASAAVASPSPAPANTAQEQRFNTEIPYTGDLVVCLLPVPRAIRNLGLLAKSRPDVSRSASAEVDYLLAQYCRKVSNPTFAAMGEMEAIGENCTQMSSVLKGDQVYWVTCEAHYDQLE